MNRKLRLPVLAPLHRSEYQEESSTLELEIPVNSTEEEIVLEFSRLIENVPWDDLSFSESFMAFHHLRSFILIISDRLKERTVSTSLVYVLRMKQSEILSDQEGR